MEDVVGRVLIVGSGAGMLMAAMSAALADSCRGIEVGGLVHGVGRRLEFSDMPGRCWEVEKVIAKGRSVHYGSHRSRAARAARWS